MNFDELNREKKNLEIIIDDRMKMEIDGHIDFLHQYSTGDYIDHDDDDESA
jgi:hypothetical protein